MESILMVVKTTSLLIPTEVSKLVIKESSKWGGELNVNQIQVWHFYDEVYIEIY